MNIRLLEVKSIIARPLDDLRLGLDNGSPVGSSSEKYTHKMWSGSVNLYYEYMRWYDPVTGRFISPDPRQGTLSLPESFNLYIYVLDLPTSLTDPSGMCGYWDVVCKAGAAWNGLSSDQRTIIVAVAITVAIVGITVLTGGAATPIIVGALIGAGTSSSLYTVTHNPFDPRSGFSLWGLAAAGSTGAMFGALGGAAGPLGGTLSKAFTGTTEFGKIAAYGIVATTSLTFDSVRGADPTTTTTDAVLSMATFGAMDYLYPTPSVKSMAQFGAQAPGMSGLAEALVAPSAADPTVGAIARSIVWGGLFGSLAGDATQDFIANPLRQILGF